MIERSILDSEREYALSWCNVPAPVRRLRAFSIGFVVGAILSGGAAFAIKYVALDLVWQFSSIASVVYFGSVTLVCAVLLGWYSIRDAYKCTEFRIKHIDAINADLDHGIVHEYSGEVTRAVFDKKANPEHPPLRVEFACGDVVELSAHEQNEHQIHSEPKRRFTIARLPISQSVVHASYT